MPPSPSSTNKTKGVATPGNYQRHALRYIEHNAKEENRGNQKSLFIHYKKKNGRTVKRKVSPLSLKSGRMLAFDHKRKALRSFYLDKVKHMEKSAFWAGFAKSASSAAELAGLGILAAPSVAHFAGKDVSPATQHGAEIAGLGILAAPYAKNLAKAAPAAREALKGKGFKGMLNVLRHA